MRPKRIMLIAGEASGDANAADLVKALGEAIPNSQFRITNDVQPLTTPLPPRFFGAGGPKMAEAGVELAFDLAADSVIGISDVLKKMPKFLRTFRTLVNLAIERQPDLIILVDFAGFNRRFAHAIREFIRAREGTFYNWRPRIVQFISPQVWASRPGRADKLAKDIDLLLCLFPGEKDWYAKRVPQLRVEFVGHPMLDRFATDALSLKRVAENATMANHQPQVLLLPGSRKTELQRHLPVILGAARQIASRQNVHFKMVLPSEELVTVARQFGLESLPHLEVRIGRLAESLSQAALAIASSGTVTLECAYFGVPTVVIYKTSWSTYQIARRIVRVKYLAMPNLLANEAVFPEFIQQAATAENIARESLDLLNNPVRREAIKSKLSKSINSLGGSGSSQRAAQAIVKMMGGVWNPDLRATLSESTAR
jgi:lipid-A-disaccharide synthase